MKRLILVLMLGSASTLTLGQDWSIFGDSATSIFFKDSSDAIINLKIDSVFQSTGASEYYIAPTVELFNHSSLWCAGHPNGNVVVGNPLIQRDSSVIYTYGSGSLTIPLFHDSAVSYLSNDTIVVRKIKKFDTILNGFQDSVMQFEISGTVKNSYYRGSLGSIMLSKKNGLIFQASRLIDLPGIGYNATHPLSPVLTRVNNPSLTKPASIYDFDVGDEFQFYDEYETYGFSSYYSTISLIDYKILSKTNLGQSYSYDVLYKHQYTKDSSTTDTVTWALPKTIDGLDSTSFKLTVLPNGSNRFWVWNNNWNQTNRNYLRLQIDYVLHSHDTCLALWNDDVVRKEVLVEGLGMVYKSMHTKSSGFVSGNVLRLIYYKKGSETWGSQKFLGIDEEEKPEIDVYPVPASATINFQYEEALLWEIIDIHGRQKLVGKVIPNEINEIDIQELSGGVYLLRLSDGSTARFQKL